MSKQAAHGIYCPFYAQGGHSTHQPGPTDVAPDAEFDGDGACTRKLYTFAGITADAAPLSEEAQEDGYGFPVSGGDRVVGFALSTVTYDETNFGALMSLIYAAIEPIEDWTIYELHAFGTHSTRDSTLAGASPWWSVIYLDIDPAYYNYDTIDWGGWTLLETEDRKQLS